MKKIIKKILKEYRFDTSAHQQLSDANSKTARLHGVDPDDWYLGTQIYYKHGWLGKQSGNCIFLGSPDYEILVEKLALINPNFWKREDKGYKKYCDIINKILLCKISKKGYHQHSSHPYTLRLQLFEECGMLLLFCGLVS